MKRKNEEETSSPKKLKQTLLNFKLPLIKFEKQEIDQKGSFIYYSKHFLDSKESLDFFNHLLKLPFHESQIKMFGKLVTVPRLQLVMNKDGEKQTNVYSTEKPMIFTNEVKEIKEKNLNCEFNYVLLNYYRDGNDYISFHNDKEAIDEKKNIIAPLSIGEARKFVMKNMETEEKKEFGKWKFDCNGRKLSKILDSFCSKTKNKGKRINLTFRMG